MNIYINNMNQRGSEERERVHKINVKTANVHLKNVKLST